MARDHFAYVGAYRKCIDEISQYKKEIWNIVIDSKTDHSVRIQALKELHSLSKTYTLLIKDIPFVTNISKDYDKDILDLNYNDLSYSKGTYSNDVHQENKRNFNTIIDQSNILDYAEIEDSHITDTINSSKGFEIRQDKRSKALQAQSNYDINNTSSQEHLA